MQRRKPAYQIIDGVPRCIALTPDRLRGSLHFRAKEGDLVQSTFPKSGTHWLLYITQLILRNGQPMTTYQDFAKEWRFLEYMDIKNFSSSLPLRTFVTHLALDKRTMTEEGKYIYLTRNPWDICVSFYHMMTNMSLFGFQDGKFEDFVDAFIGGHLGYGDYFEHVAAGYALRKQPNVLFVAYEELKKNTREEVLRVAYFLGEQYGRSLEQDGHEGDENKYAYVRTGKVGGWRDHFTPDLLRKMESRILEAEKQSTFMDLWKDLRAETLTRMRDAE
ncbi:hypothetical protein HPB52_005680 [Rhipicephalus sanguineus]|uniref:Sulfotransferase domain-containing protein n=1 Tax=Rhipicephalus sanguineus TaxID=34632 RepID=A0A9D4SWF6_RHISA|nr:hypothetical protein HPB52_005680 [Rhipicephalus sanguineus]